VLGALIKVVEKFFELAHGPGQEPLIFGLIVALASLIISHVLALIQFRGRLRDKDRHIDDLVQQRNRFQEVALQSKGITRKSTHKEQSK
jgi:hypothetical protein